MTNANPVLVEVTRGGAVESRHRGAAVVVDSRGRQMAAWGDVEAVVFPRSSVKPLQALPMLEAGAVERFAVSSTEVALACASHGGEPAHVEAVRCWLARLRLGEDDLICGAHPPLSAAAAQELTREHREPSRLHNNCSGKHTGFLTLALHLRAPVERYGDPEHPVQRLVRRTLSEMGGVDLATAPSAVDGCGVPVFGMPLSAIARGFARLAARDILPTARAVAARRIVAAMTTHPFFVAGAGRFDTLVIEQAAGRVLVKGGAEGVCAAALLDRGLGLAVKIDDGAKRAAESAMAALLARFAGGDEALVRTLSTFGAKAVLDTRGSTVGSLRPALGWLD
jgi:L-asparaginase II